MPALLWGSDQARIIRMHDWQGSRVQPPCVTEVSAKCLQDAIFARCKAVSATQVIGRRTQPA